eukprot:Lithocolla_globosa_v1_NODE_58_length_7390_cov_243.140014.p7 type:complete len:124 gc:universal NODE_58_length_7390_cov_243.140014:3332-2961(-)
MKGRKEVFSNKTKTKSSQETNNQENIQPRKHSTSHAINFGILSLSFPTQPTNKSENTKKTIKTKRSPHAINFISVWQSTFFNFFSSRQPNQKNDPINNQENNQENNQNINEKGKELTQSILLV